MNAQRLKLLAILSMTIDHLGVAFHALHRYNIAGAAFARYTTDAYWQMRIVGRLAFPIFCFLIAEGCAHTKNLKKYIGRLAAFAIISQVPYHVFLSMSMGIGLDGAIQTFLRFPQGNVLITLTLGAAAVYCYRQLYDGKKGKVLCIAGIFAALIAVILMRGEYDVCGIIIILLVYIFRAKTDASLDRRVPGNQYLQALCCACVTCAYYVLALHATTYEVLGATFSALPLLLYNGQPGNRKWKWGFYVYYPAHMLVLSAVMYVVMV